MKPGAIPDATYRLQFNRDFTFADATRIIPYLHDLGISHVYASPFVKARAGSPHGYDIVDHNSLNPELGDVTDFHTYVDTLRRHGMGQILDIVPNHMGVGGDDNGWWLDVLEHGEASPYAAYFDIDWYPVNPALHHKVLLPFLADHYGTILELGELTLELDSEHGAFQVRYYTHLFPLDPASYDHILDLHGDRLVPHIGAHHPASEALGSCIAACRALPQRSESAAGSRQQRRQGAVECKRRVAGLYRDHPEARAWLDENIARINGQAGHPQSFDRLHQLLEVQAYRLAYWQVASDEINYRRFFDINELAGVRMENSEVFTATHDLVRQLLANGQVHGLRIDHPDGLADPYKYCCDLQRMIAHTDDRTTLDVIQDVIQDATQDHRRPGYLLVEKILAGHERLPGDWPVAGTTGYEVAQLLNGLFIHAESERPLTQLYRRFSGQLQGFDERLYECKWLIMRGALASELTVLANLASSIAQADRHTRDFTYHSLRNAIAEVVACFPVYRTYITAQRISAEDQRHVHWAVARAKKRSTAADILIFDFIQELLTLTRPADPGSPLQQRMAQFALRFQQYTAPVMAKGMEDTALYSYNRLVSLNDVGFDPRLFAVSINAFHHENRQRLAQWPHSMVTTSTHDSKRGEDTRARIDVLSELPQEWRLHLSRWSRINRHKKRVLDETRAPSRNDEYLLYQTLLGSWPLEPLDAQTLEQFHERIDAYMLKAIREAKVHTSWINPNREYEEAMAHFVQALLHTPRRNAFLADFIPFQRRLLRYGLLTGLSQTLLKLTVPGVPDIYQGNELWCFNLVDPDNRRPVDFRHRQTQLQALASACQDRQGLPALLQQLLEQLEDGRAKLYLSWRILGLRRRLPALFHTGEYLELASQGPRDAHICAFARRLQHHQAIVAATRWFTALSDDPGHTPLGSPVWDGTWIQAPDAPDTDKVPTDARTQCYRNILTDETVQPRMREGGLWFSAADLFRHFPVALLTCEYSGAAQDSVTP